MKCFNLGAFISLGVFVSHKTILVDTLQAVVPTVCVAARRSSTLSTPHPPLLPQVYDGDIETVFQVLFTDSEFMREFLHSRGTTSKHNNTTSKHNNNGNSAEDE